MRFFQKIAIFSILVLAPAKALLAEPVVYRDHYPFRAHLINQSAVSDDFTEQGKFSNSTSLGWGNTFIKNKNLLVDLESVSADIQFRYGISEKDEVYLALGWWWQGGGILDQSIDSWHELFGFSRGSRDTEKDRQVRIQGESKSGDTFDLSESGGGLDKFQVGYKYDLCGKGSKELSCLIFSDLRLPIGTDYVHPGIDVNIGSMVGYPVFSGQLSLGGAIQRIGDTESKGVSYERIISAVFMNYEYPIFADLHLWLDFNLMESGVEKLNKVPDIGLYTTFGVSYKFANSVVIFGVRENPFFDDSTTDFSTHLSLNSQL